MTQQLQWSGVDVDASQFKVVRDLGVNALGMHPVVDQSNFPVLVAVNGSSCEIYGPGSSDRPWRHGQGGLAVGFLTDDIAVTIKAIQKSVGVLLDNLNVLPKADVEGGELCLRILQSSRQPRLCHRSNKNYHAH